MYSSGDRGSIPGRVIPKIKKIILDTSLLNTQHYRVRIKGKEDQSGSSYSIQYSNYLKESHRVGHDNVGQLIFSVDEN